MSNYCTTIECDVIGEIDVIVQYDYTRADRDTDSDAVVEIHDVLLCGVALSPQLLDVLLKAKSADWKVEILEKEDAEMDEIGQGIVEWSAGI